MTATVHPFPVPASGLRDRVYDLERANLALAKKIMLAEHFARQAHEYASRQGDALLAQMMQEFLGRMER
jgi:hypothetical protein